MTLKTSTLIIVISLSAVILAGTGISIWLGVTYTPPLVDTDHPDQDWEFMVTGNIVGDDFNISIKELLNMPQHEADYEIKSDPAYTSTFIGVKISYLFDVIIDIDPSATTVTFVAWDGYSKLFPIVDILANDSNILAHSIDGAFMENYPDGGNGYLRLIMPSYGSYDPNSEFCVKNVVEILFA